MWPTFARSSGKRRPVPLKSRPRNRPRPNPDRICEPRSPLELYGSCENPARLIHAQTMKNGETRVQQDLLIRGVYALLDEELANGARTFRELSPQAKEAIQDVSLAWMLDELKYAWEECVHVFGSAPEGAPKPKRAGKPNGKANGQPKGKAATEGGDIPKIRAALSGADRALTIIEIEKHVSLPKPRIKAALGALVLDGSVRKEGKAKGTRYRV